MGKGPLLGKDALDAVASAPAHLIAEVLGGTLHTSPRPRTSHARAAARLGSRLGAGFDEGTIGPGGWVILPEPELHLGPDPDIVVPDLAGWRRERMPEMPDAPFLTLAPDWVCEVSSPSTRGVDRAKKAPIYAREAVTHLWLLDPGPQTLEILKLDGSRYRVLERHGGGDLVAAPPFDALPLPLGVLWAR